MPDRMVREGAKFSPRVAVLGERAECAFWRLLTTVDINGVYYADPLLVRAAIWPTKSYRVPEVVRALDDLKRAGLIAEWTAKDGVRYMCLLRFRQRERMKYDEKPRFPTPPFDIEDGEQRLLLTDADPPPDKEKKREGRGIREPRREAPPAPTPMTFELQEDWLARLARDWPGLNVLAELENAKRKKARTGEKLDRVWFEKSWLPNCGPVVSFATTNLRAEAVEPEPEAWRVWLETEYPESAYSKGGRDEGMRWAELPAEVRGKIYREMAREDGKRVRT